MDMARPKEFDLERALHRAISAFSQKGFAATSTDELMRAMEVGRQSMYDTFGDKRALFLKAPEVATLTRCWSLFWIHAVASVHAHVQPHSLPRFRVYPKQSR
jgi:hypothetical protein